MSRAFRKAAGIQGQIHIDTYLTDFSLRLQQNTKNFVAGVASSLITVQKESDKYAIYPPGYFWRDEAQVRPLGGRPVQVGYAVKAGQYLAEEWALEHMVDDRQRTNVDDPIKLDENATKLLSGKQMIRADRIWCQNFFTPNSWGMTVEGGADFTPFNDAGSDPVAIIDDYKEQILLATGMEPNTLVLGSGVKKALRTNPSMVDRVKYTQTGIITDAMMASLFEVDQIRVARAVYNAAAERMPDDDDGGEDFQFIADTNSVLLAYIDPSPSLDSATAIARFAWNGLIPGQTNDMGGVLERGRDERAHSDWFQNRQAYDMRKVSDDLAVFLHQAITPVSN